MTQAQMFVQTRSKSQGQVVRWLRISYWWGLIADAVMAVLMLYPEWYIEFTKADVELTADFEYGLRFGAPLMIGWTVLLFWADRDPLARKDILPLTLIVVAGYMVFQVLNIGSVDKLIDTAPIFLHQVAMSSMFIFSYLNARRFEAGA